MQIKEAPMEIIDTYRWDERCKLITRNIHGISGLMNFTHLKILTSEPSTVRHYHKNLIEIHCIVKGRRSNRLYLGEEMEDHTYTGGEAFVVFPGEHHSTGDDSQQAPCEVFALQLNVSEADDFLGLNRRMGNDLCRRLSELGTRHFRMNPEDLTLLREAFSLCSSADERDRDEGLMHLVCFLYRFLRLSPVLMPLKASLNSDIQRAVDYIHENICEPLSLAALASLTGYSLSRFKTKFREVTGQTPAFYISSCKVEHAKKALVDSSQSITDIAYNLGWSSGNYFCSVFKKLTGMSPLQYRKHNRYDNRS